jgi:CubicO group peptidase (beta-lactamase class C family)
LVQEGKLKLDEDVGEFFRANLGKEGEELWKQIYPQDFAGGEAPKVTIRQLLSHTAGIPEGGRGYACVEVIDHQFLEEVQLFARGLLSPVPGFDSAAQDLDSLQKECAKANPDAVLGIEQRILQKQQEILSLVGTIPTTLSQELQMARERLQAMHNLRKEEAVSRMSIPTADDILHGQNKRQGSVQVKNRPGEVFEYSNMGFTVLQRVVEVVTKKSFSDAVRDMVLEPLGMKETTYAPALEKTIHGSDEKGEPLLCSWVLTPHLAAGGLWTNATEFAQVVFAIQGALSNTPLPGKKAPLISKDLVEQMMEGTAQSEKETQVEGRGYGLGIGVDGRAESRYFVHDGVLPGTRTCLRGNSDKGIIALTNSSNGEHLYREIVKSVAEAYGWPGRDALEIWESKVKQEEYFSPPLTRIPSAQAQMKVESWAARAAGTWVTLDDEGKKHSVGVYCEGSKLFIDIDGGKAHEGGKTYELLPLGEKVGCFRPHSPGPYEVCRVEEGRRETSINVGGVTYTRAGVS